MSVIRNSLPSMQGARECHSMHEAKALFPTAAEGDLQMILKSLQLYDNVHEYYHTATVPRSLNGRNFKRSIGADSDKPRYELVEGQLYKLHYDCNGSPETGLKLFRTLREVCTICLSLTLSWRKCQLWEGVSRK